MLISLFFIVGLLINNYKEAEQEEASLRLSITTSEQ